MKLITEQNWEEVNVITERNRSVGGKNYFIEGIFLQSDLKNQNGRIYPFDVMINEVNRYSNNFIKNNRAFGELGHPDGPSINLDRVSHMIKELRLEGKNFVGKAKIVDTPHGKIVKSLIDEGAKLGVSSRGVGSVKHRNGVDFVQDDFILATPADIVADPSAPDAFVNGIMENKEFYWDGQIFKEQDVARVKRYIEKTSKKNLEEAKIKSFENLLNSL